MDNFERDVDKWGGKGVVGVFLGVEVEVKTEVKVEVKAEVRFVFFSIKAANKEGEGGRLGNFGKCGRLLA